MYKDISFQECLTLYFGSPRYRKWRAIVDRWLELEGEQYPRHKEELARAKRRMDWMIAEEINARGILGKTKGR